MTIYTALQMSLWMVLALFWGPYSDYVGRKRALIVPLVGVIAHVVVVIIIVAFNLNVYLILIACLLDGLCGGNPVFFGAVCAYIADVTNKSNRSQRNVVIQAMAVFGGSLAHALSGFLIDHYGLLVAYVIGSGIIAICFFYVTLWVPESMTNIRASAFFRFEHIKNIVMVLFKDDGTGSLWKIQVMYCYCQYFVNIVNI